MPCDMSYLPHWLYVAGIVSYLPLETRRFENGSLDKYLVKSKDMVIELVLSRVKRHNRGGFNFRGNN